MNKKVHDLIGKISDIGRKKSAAKKEQIFIQGASADVFGYVLNGEVRVYKMDMEGREKEVGRFGPGNFFGEVIVFATDTYPVFAEASKDSEILFIPKEAVFARIKSDPSIAEAFLSLLAKKCLSLSSQIETLTLKTVRQRLIQYLLRKCSGRGCCTVRLTTNKTQLARNLGTVSETLSRNLRVLQDEGLITVSNKTIEILNCDLLRSELPDF
jgi:CRP/FNR family transcriptional regulator